MKLISIPQLSVIKDGRFEYRSDSNYNFNINLKKAFEFSYPQAQFKLILPSEYHKFFIPNVYESRFSFNFSEAKKILLEEKPNLILENNPTNVICWHYLRDSLKMQFAVITYNHWLDTVYERKAPADYTYMFRQFEGHFLAERSGFNSNYAIELFQKNSGLFHERLRTPTMSKCYKLPPLVDCDALDLFFNNQQKENYVVYNHRLSTLPYYADALKAFSKIINENKKLLEKYTIFITNPDKKEASKIKEQYFSDIENIKFVDLNMKEYYSLLSKCKLGFCLFNGHGMWSISAVEASYFMPVLGLNRAGYSELLQSECKFKTIHEISSHLEDFIDKPINNKEWICRNIDIKCNKYTQHMFDSLVLQ